MQLIDVWQLLQWSDSSLPTGGFAQSHGLETLVQEGLVQNGEHLVLSVRAYVEQVAYTELLAFWHVVRADDLFLALTETNQGLNTLLWTAEAREASQGQASRYIKLWHMLSGDSDVLDLSLPASLYAGAAWGYLGRRLRIPQEIMAAAFLHTQALEFSQAALRLLRMDPMDAVASRYQLATVIADLVRQSECLAWLDGVPMVSPVLEIAALRHQRQEMRLFRT